MTFYTNICFYDTLVFLCFYHGMLFNFRNVSIMARTSYSEKELFTRLRSSSPSSLSFQGIFSEIKSGKVLGYQLQVKIENEQLTITSYSTEGRSKAETISLSHVCLDIFDEETRRFCIHFKNGGLRVFQLCVNKSTSPNYTWRDLVTVIRRLSVRKVKPLVGKSVELSTRITCSETAPGALFSRHHIDQNIIFEYFFVELNLKGSDNENLNLHIQCSYDKFIDEINDNTLLALSRKIMLVQGYKKDIKKLWFSQEKIRDYKYYTKETNQFSPYRNRSNSVDVLNYVRKFEKRNKVNLAERMSIYSLKLPTKLLSTKRPRIITKRLSNIEAEHLACELTYINKILLLKVRIDDVQSINSQCISEMYANNSLVIWMTFSEQMRNMVVAEVVIQKDMLERLQAMRYFMKVAIVCWKIQNFNTTANILCAFHSPAIYNLKKAWDCFKMKYPFTYHSFQKLSSVFFEDNCRSYRNAFRKAIDNPPYIPWISHFLNHTIIPTWKTYVHGWKKNRIRNLLNEKLQPLQCRRYITNSNLYISELTKTRSYKDWRNMSDPTIKQSIKGPKTNEENNLVNTTQHKVSYKEFFPEVNKYHMDIKDIDIQNAEGSYKKTTTQKLNKAELNLALGQIKHGIVSDDLTNKKAYRFRTHYQVQRYQLKSSDEKRGKSTSTKSKTDSSPTTSTSDNMPKSTSTSNANGEESISIASSFSLPTENINKSSVPNNKGKTNQIEKRNEANDQEVDENISASFVVSQNTKEGQITGGKRVLSATNSDSSDYREVVEISQEYVKENDTQNICKTLPKLSFSQSSVLNENANKLVPTMRRRSETCFHVVYQHPLSMNENMSEPEYFQGVSVSSSIEKLSRTLPDISAEKLSFENISKEVSIFQKYPEKTNSLKHNHEEDGVLEHDYEESHAIEQVSKEIGVFHTISEQGSILKNIPGEDCDLQAISGEVKPFNNVSDEVSIAEKFQEVSCAFKHLRDEIIALENLPEEANVLENILNESDAFDKIRDVAGALEMFVKEVGCFEMLLLKEDAFEKIREIADVVKTIVEEVSGYKNACKQVTDNISNTLVNEASRDVNKQINEKQENRLCEVPLKLSYSKSSISSKSSAKSVSYISSKRHFKNINEKDGKDQSVRFNISKSNISTKMTSEISSRSMSDVRKPRSASFRSSNESVKSNPTAPCVQASKTKPLKRNIPQNSIQKKKLKKSDEKTEANTKKENILQAKNIHTKQRVLNTEKKASNSTGGERCCKCGAETDSNLNKEDHIVQNSNRSALNLRDKMRSKIREILMKKYKGNCSTTNLDQTLYNFYKLKGGKSCSAAYFDLWKCSLCGCDVCIYADLPQSLLLCFQKAANCYNFQSQYNVRMFLKSYIFTEMEKLFTESKN
uniref:Ras-GEF domain-containing protein n=2 Tax=Octopus bimaculoides TaxID=37653 RepID=A0A0L8HX69_OCTBM